MVHNMSVARGAGVAAVRHTSIRHHTAYTYNNLIVVFKFHKDGRIHPRVESSDPTCSELLWEENVAADQRGVGLLWKSQVLQVRACVQHSPPPREAEKETG